MRVLILTAMVLLAGCAGQQADEEPDTTTPTQTSSSSTSTSTTQSTTTAPPPEDCEPTVRSAGTQYVAECTVVRALDPSSQPDLTVDTANGYIQVRDGDDRATARLWARADSEDAARAALEAMTLTIDPDAISIVVTSPNWSNRGADIAVALSTGVLGDANLDTSNGLIEVEDFGGLDWILDTSNGDVRVSGGAESINIDTSNGGVEVNGATISLVIDSSNGPIDIRGQHVDMQVDGTNGAVTIDASASATGTWDVATSNGRISITVPEPADTGYDVSASTSNADATITLRDTEAVGTQDNDSKHRRTTDFDDRAVQLTVNADSSNASVVVKGGPTA